MGENLEVGEDLILKRIVKAQLFVVCRLYRPIE